MSEDEGSSIYYISRSEFRRRLAEMNVGLTEIGKRYATILAKRPDAKNSEQYKQEIESITDDIRHNMGMMNRANIEDGYTLFWVDGENSLKMRRCSRKEHDEIYNPREKPHYII